MRFPARPTITSNFDPTRAVARAPTCGGRQERLPGGAPVTRCACQIARTEQLSIRSSQPVVRRGAAPVTHELYSRQAKRCSCVQMAIKERLTAGLPRNVELT